MIRDDQHWLELTDAFHAAAIDPDGWYAALAAFADATGSQHGQLMCFGEEVGAPQNLLTNVDPDLPAAFVAAGGTDPSINPRRRAGVSRPPLTIIAEEDFITPDQYHRDTHYQEFAVPWDVPYICLTTVERRANLLVGLAVVRTRQQGHIDAAGRRAFASIAPHVRAAVRTNLALADHGDALLSDALDRLSIPAFVCDRFGLVRRLTPAAESLVASDRGIEMKLGKLTARQPTEANALADAITAAATERRALSPATRVIVVHGADKKAPLAIDVIPLPSRCLPLAFDARVLILVRGFGTPDEERRRVILQSVYGMTAAETEIALQLSTGKTVEAIAQARTVGIGTVRGQIKALLAKAGVSRQVELVARLNQL
jgi:DNA-binding CsgD family transcriptional regulator/phage tail protein X